MRAGVARRHACSISASPTFRLLGGAQVGCPRRVGGRTQDVADLRGVRQWVQVGGGCGVASGLCSMLPGLVSRALRRSVRIQRSDALQHRSCGAVGKLPGSLDSRARTGVFWVSLFEQGKDSLSVVNRVTGYDSQLVHDQLEVACSSRHASSLANTAGPLAGSPEDPARYLNGHRMEFLYGMSFARSPLPGDWCGQIGRGGMVGGGEPRGWGDVRLGWPGLPGGLIAVMGTGEFRAGGPTEGYERSRCDA